MAQTIVGLYDDASQVKSLLNELQSLGLTTGDIRVAGGLAGIPQQYTGNAMELVEHGSVPADEQGFYKEAVRRGSTLVAARVDEGDVQRVSDLMGRYDAVAFEDRYADYQARGFTGYDAQSARYTDDEVRTERERYARGEVAPGAEEIRAKIVEERLRIGKREVEGGGARLNTYVTTEQVDETVTLRDEKVNVERVDTGERRATEADLAEAFQDRTIEMRETSEEAVVQKDAVVTGEVVMTKETGSHEERVSEEVRRTNVDVERIEGSGATGAVHFDDADFRTHHQQTYGSTGRGYDAYAPSYRYGYDAASRYSGDYATHEADLRRDYEGRYADSAWEDTKDAVKTGFQKARNAVTGGDDGNRATRR